jgi:hypothetical protein
VTGPDAGYSQALRRSFPVDVTDTRLIDGDRLMQYVDSVAGRAGATWKDSQVEAAWQLGVGLAIVSNDYTPSQNQIARCFQFVFYVRGPRHEVECRSRWDDATPWRHRSGHCCGTPPVSVFEVRHPAQSMT